MPPVLATDTELEEFHTKGYISSLKKYEKGIEEDDTHEKFGFIDDCHLFPGYILYFI